MSHIASNNKSSTPMSSTPMAKTKSAERSTEPTVTPTKTPNTATAAEEAPREAEVKAPPLVHMINLDATSVCSLSASHPSPNLRSLSPSQYRNL